MIVGTDHFVSRIAARSYYYNQIPDLTRSQCIKLIEEKLELEEIFIGRPVVRPGERLRIIDDGTRYAIETYDKPEEVEIMKK